MHHSTPEDEHPTLTTEWLRIIAQTMIEVRDEVITDCYQPKKGDGPWSLGCHCFDRTRNRIIGLAKEYEWLEILEPDLEFVFAVGGVPVRFHRESDECPKTKLKPQPPFSAVQTTFPGEFAGTANLRFVVITAEDNRAHRVDLVKYSDLEVTEERWTILTRSELTESNVTPFQEPGRELPPPKIGMPDSREVGRDE